MRQHNKFKKYFSFLALLTLFACHGELGAAGTFIKGPALIEGFTTISSSGGTTTLTKDSETKQIVTGATTQTITLPSALTLPLGRMFYVLNKSTGTVTVNANGGGLVASVLSGQQKEFHLRAAGSAAGTWDATRILVDLSNDVTGTLGVASGGTGRASLTSAAVLVGNGTGAVNFVSGSVSGDALIFDGTNWTSQAVSTGGGAGTITGPATTVSGEVTVFGNTTGTVLNRATGTGWVKMVSGVISSQTAVNVSTDTTGIANVANGGTGKATLTANTVLLGNGTSPLKMVAGSVSGDVLTYDGSTWTSQPASASAGATAAHYGGYLDLATNSTLWQVTSQGYANFGTSTTPSITIRDRKTITVSGGGAGVQPTFAVGGLEVGATYHVLISFPAWGSAADAHGYRAITSTQTIGEASGADNGATLPFTAVHGFFTATATTETITLQGRANAGSARIGFIGVNAANTMEVNIIKTGGGSGGGNVISSTAGIEGIERAYVTQTAGSYTLVRSTPGITGVTKNAAGDTTINFAVGTFSTAPTCVYTGADSLNFGFLGGPPTTSGSQVLSYTTGGATQESGYQVICMGPR